MNLPIRQIDAFSEGPFTGNPAAVVLLEAPIAPELMQRIAEENNLSETAFVVPLPDGGGYALRWFTPTVEVELGGHATLAAAEARASDSDEAGKRVAALEAELKDEMTACWKEAVKYGSLEEGPHWPVSAMFEDVFKEMPAHLRKQRQDLGV